MASQLRHHGGAQIQDLSVKAGDDLCGRAGLRQIASTGLQCDAKDLLADLVGDGLGLRFGIGLFGHTKHSSRHMFLTPPLFHDRGGKSIRPENLMRFRFTFVHRPMELFSFSTSSASGSSTTSRLTQPLRTLASVSTARS